MRILGLAFFTIWLAGCTPPSPIEGSGVLAPSHVESALSRCPQCSLDANQVANKLTALGFNCALTVASEKRGFRCHGNVAKYSMPIDFYIAPRFQTTKPYALALHFHGWWINSSTDPFAGNAGDFGATLGSSDKNMILIVPESQGQNDTYASDLANSAQMNTLLQNLDQVLIRAGVSVTPNRPLVVSGHSGAYVLIGRLGEWAASGEVPALQHVRGLILLDSAYGYRAGLVKFMDVMCPSGMATYFITFNPNETTAKTAVNEQIYHEITSTHACANANVEFMRDLKTPHMSFPRQYLSTFYTTALADF